MASGFIPKPGTNDYAHCKEECKHKDCAEQRKFTKMPCRICKEPIGYDRHFYQEKSWTVLVHESCAEDEEEKRRAAL